MKIEKKRYLLVTAIGGPGRQKFNQLLREKILELEGVVGLARSSVHIVHHEEDGEVSRYIIRSSLGSTKLVRTAVTLLPFFVEVTLVSGTIAKLRRVLGADNDAS